MYHQDGVIRPVLGLTLCGTITVTLGLGFTKTNARAILFSVSTSHNIADVP